MEATAEIPQAVGEEGPILPEIPKRDLDDLVTWRDLLPVLERLLLSRKSTVEEDREILLQLSLRSGKEDDDGKD